MIRKRILIADDEELIRMIVRTALGDDYEISEAADGEETWKKLSLAEPQFDLLIVDWNMPRVGGRELLERIFARDPTTRVLLLSGSLDCPARQSATVRLMNKPFNNSELAATVGELLAKQKSGVIAPTLRPDRNRPQL